jgi:hypothetical protein
MQHSSIRWFVILSALVSTACAGRGIAQTGLPDVRDQPRAPSETSVRIAPAESIEISETDRLFLAGIPPGLRQESWSTVLARFARSTRGFQVKLRVHIADRTLTALVGRDTVFHAPVGVASGMTLRYAGQSWKFQTPKGGRRILGKVSDPVWTPPDWHYAEVARENGLRLARLSGKGTKLKDGSRLTVKNRVVGLTYRNGKFAPLPIDEHVVFGNQLFIPPVGTLNRRIAGELGNFALDLGGGYLIHGTPDPTSIGQRSTHGCIRVRDQDLEWLFENVPVGSSVVIH